MRWWQADPGGGGGGGGGGSGGGRGGCGRKGFVMMTKEND